MNEHNYKKDFEKIKNRNMKEVILELLKDSIPGNHKIKIVETKIEKEKVLVTFCFPYSTRPFNTIYEKEEICEKAYSMLES